MKAMELFSGAVVLYNGKPATWFTWDTVDSHDLIQGDIVYGVRTKDLSPLPLSPAVLVGLGFVKRPRGNWEHSTYGIMVYPHRADFYMDAPMLEGPEDGTHITHAHQLQALALHLHGVELEWNQDAYEKAMKEEI